MSLVSKFLFLANLFFLISCNSVAHRTIAGKEASVDDSEKFVELVEQQRVKYINRNIGPIWFQGALLHSTKSESKVVSLRDYKKRVQLVQEFLRNNKVLEESSLENLEADRLTQLEAQLKDLLESCCEVPPLSLELESDYPFLQQAIIANKIWTEGYSGVDLVGTTFLAGLMSAVIVIVNLKEDNPAARDKVTRARQIAANIGSDYIGLEDSHRELMKASSPKGRANTVANRDFYDYHLSRYRHYERSIEIKIARLNQLFEKSSEFEKRMKNMRLAHNLPEVERSFKKLQGEGRELIKLVNETPPLDLQNSWSKNHPRLSWIRTPMAMIAVTGLIYAGMTSVDEYKLNKLGKYYEQFRKFWQPNTVEFNSFLQDIYAVSQFSGLVQQLSGSQE